MSNELMTVNTATGEIMTANDNENLIVDLTSAKQAYCSMNAQTPAEKAALFTATNNSQHRLSEKINEIITVQHIYVEVVMCTNKETGLSEYAPRVVFLDDKNEGYQCVSIGIYSAVKKMFQIFGEPSTWEKPLSIKVKQVTKGERKMLTFDVLGQVK